MKRALQLLGFVVCLVGCARAPLPPAVVETAPVLASADPAQAPIEATLKRLDDSVEQLSAYRGRVVLLDFWATWCGPCKRSLPFYATLQVENRPRGLSVVAVSVDENRGALERFLAKNPLPVDVFYDPLWTLRDLVDAHSLPATYLLDRQGVIRARYDGFGYSTAALVTADVAALLAEPAAP